MRFTPTYLEELSPSLFSDRGKFDALKIADAFGMSHAEMARALETSEDSMTTEPDADSLQPRLHQFARIHLITLLRQVTPEVFKKWLRSEIENLDWDTPMALILNGEAEIVSQLAENLVTSQPG